MPPGQLQPTSRRFLARAAQADSIWSICGSETHLSSPTDELSVCRLPMNRAPKNKKPAASPRIGNLKIEPAAVRIATGLGRRLNTPVCKPVDFLAHPPLPEPLHVPRH